MRKDKFKFVLIRTTMNEWMGDHQHSKLKTSENILENMKKKCFSSQLKNVNSKQRKYFLDHSTPMWLQISAAPSYKNAGRSNF